MKARAFSLLAAAVLPYASAATYTITESDTAMAYSFLTGWNMTSLYPNMVSPANTGVSNHHMSAFLQYDLGALVSAGVTSAEITTATARLYLIDNAEAGFGSSPTADYPVSIDFRVIGQAWSSATLTWANQPGGAYNPTTTLPSGTLAGTISGIDASGVWVELDITALVKSWLDSPETNHGLRLTQTSEVRDATGNAAFPAIASSGNTDEALRPQLVVTTVPEPSSFAISILAGAAFLGFRRRHAA